MGGLREAGSRCWLGGGRQRVGVWGGWREAGGRCWVGGGRQWVGVGWVEGGSG